MTPNRFKEICNEMHKTSCNGRYVSLNLLNELVDIEALEQAGIWNEDVSSFINQVSFIVKTHASPQELISLIEECDTTDLLARLAKNSEG